MVPPVAWKTMPPAVAKESRRRWRNRPERATVRSLSTDHRRPGSRRWHPGRWTSASPAAWQPAAGRGTAERWLRQQRRRAARRLLRETHFQGLPRPPAAPGPPGPPAPAGGGPPGPRPNTIPMFWPLGLYSKFDCAAATAAGFRLADVQQTERRVEAHRRPVVRAAGTRGDVGRLAVGIFSVGIDDRSVFRWLRSGPGPS